MARDWIKLHKKLRQHPKYLALSRGDRAGYIALLLEADVYDGVFETEQQLRVAMSFDYRSVSKLRAVGLLNGLEVHGWAKAQAKTDETHSERQRRYRARQDEIESPEGDGKVTPPKASLKASTKQGRDHHVDGKVTPLDKTRRDKTRRDKPKRARDPGLEEHDQDDARPDPDDELDVMDRWLVAHKYQALSAKDRATVTAALAAKTGLRAADFVKTWEDADAGGIRMRSVLAIAMQKPGDGPKARVVLRMERRLDAENLAHHDAIRATERESAPRTPRGEGTAFETARAIAHQARAVNTTAKQA